MEACERRASEARDESSKAEDGSLSGGEHVILPSPPMHVQSAENKKVYIDLRKHHIRKREAATDYHVPVQLACLPTYTHHHNHNNSRTGQSNYRADKHEPACLLACNQQSARTRRSCLLPLMRTTAKPIPLLSDRVG